MKITCHLCGKVVTVAKGEVLTGAKFFCQSSHMTHWIKLTSYKGMVAILHGQQVINTEVK